MKNLKKVIFSFSLLALFVLPQISAAQSTEALQQQINALLKQLQQLQVQVSQAGSGGGGGGAGVSASQPTAVAIEQPKNIPNFNRDLYFGTRGNDVTDLQEFLTDQGYYAGPISGYYGLLTVQAMKKFQSANGINPTGYFGPKSRAIASEIFKKLVGQICPSEEGCEGGVLPVEKLTIWTNTDLRGTVGEYFSATFSVSGGSGNYTIDAEGIIASLNWSKAACEVGKECKNNFVQLSGVPARGGIYNVVVFAKDESGAYGKERFTVVISDKTITVQPPIISGVKGPTTLKAGEEGTWAVNAYDPNNGNLSYRVIWGDEQYGIATQEGMPQVSRPLIQTATFSHTYRNPGVYSPVFYVVSDRGMEAKTSISVNVGETITKSSIQVILPNGGEQWQKDTAQIIKWNSTNVSTVYIKLRKGSDTYPGSEGLVTNTIPNTGYYQWVVPATLPDGTDYAIRIVDGNGVTIDDSDAPFSIVTTVSQNLPPKITGGSALPPTTIQPGQVVNFSWNAQDDNKDNLAWSVNWGDGTGMAGACPISNLSSAQGWTLNTSYAWKQAGTYVVKVTVSDCKGGTDSLGLTVNVGTTTTPSIQVLSPNGGEAWFLGSTQNIRWTSSNVTRVSLDLVNSAGSLVVKNLVNITGNPGSANWVIPTYIQPGQYWMRAGTCPDSVVSCTTTGSIDPVTIYDTSDAPFSIVAETASSYSITGITGNQSSYSPGSRIEFAVKGVEGNGSAASADKGYNVQAYVFPASDINFSGSYLTPNPPDSYNGTYDAASGYWKFQMNAPSAISSYNLRVALYCSRTGSICYNAGGHGEESIRILPFTVTSGTIPSIAVLSPNGGEILTKGSIYTIKWTSSGNISNRVRLGYSSGPVSDPISWIVDSMSDTGYYGWLVDDSNSSIKNQFKVCIADYYVNAWRVIDCSDNYFTIVAAATQPPFITVTSPSGGEQYQAGQTVQIPLKWTASCSISSFNVDLYRSAYPEKGDASVQNINKGIAAGICSSGQMSAPYYTTWPIPSTLQSRSDYYIKISSGDNTVIGASAPFSIVAASGAQTPASTQSASSLDSMKSVLGQIQQAINALSQQIR